MHVEITKSTFKTVHIIKTWTIHPHTEHKKTQKGNEKRDEEEEKDVEETQGEK